MRASYLSTSCELRGDHYARMRTVVDVHHEFAERPAIFSALIVERLWRRLLVNADAVPNSKPFSVAHIRNAYEHARRFGIADAHG